MDRWMRLHPAFQERLVAGDSVRRGSRPTLAIDVETGCRGKAADTSAGTDPVADSPKKNTELGEE